MPKANSYILWFDQIDHDDIPLAGGKGANLGEMTKAGFPVPEGFVITAPAYFHFLDQNHLRPKIKQLLNNLDVHRTDELTRISQQIKSLIRKSQIPQGLAYKIIAAYLKLGKNSLVAVRSSATAEDRSHASLAGQQEPFL